MIRRALLQPLATTLVTLAVVGCSDPTQPSATPRPVSVPSSPGLQVDITPSTAVRYTEGGIMDITDAAITEVNGQPYAGGNTGTFPAGSSLTLAGKYSITASAGASGAGYTAFLGWINGGGTNRILTTVQGPTLPLTGTFTWKVNAPGGPGTYPIGAGQFITFQFQSSQSGFTGQSLFAGQDPELPDVSFAIKVDRPGIFPISSSSGSSSSLGWFSFFATINWNVVYPSELISATTGCGERTFGEGVNVATCTVTTGDTTYSDSLIVRVDLHEPSMSEPRTTPAPNAAGWWNTDATMTWDCQDAVSGPREPTVSLTFTQEGTTRNFDTNECFDKAGNAVYAFYNNFLLPIDKTAPSLAPTLSSTTIYVGDAVTATPNATDALSGIASSSCNAVITSAPGPFSVSCTAKDKADNVGTTSVNYTVLNKFAFGGFKPPIVPGTLNSRNAGSAVPVTFSLGGNKGLNILAAGSPTSKPMTCPVGAIVTTVTESATSAAGGGSLTYDALTDTYVYTWKTEKAWAGTCRTLVLKLTDGIERTADFQFKK